RVIDMQGAHRPAAELQQSDEKRGRVRTAAESDGEAAFALEWREARQRVVRLVQERVHRRKSSRPRTDGGRRGPLLPRSADTFAAAVSRRPAGKALRSRLSAEDSWEEQRGHAG